jgi:amino acid adenylation domain-containing protein
MSTAAPLPKSDLSFADVFERSAERFAQQPAIARPGRATTYAELNRLANAIARSIRERVAGPGSPVALLLDSGEAAIAGLLAAYKAGLPALPLDASAPPDSLTFILKDSGARLLVTDGAHLSLARELSAPSRLEILEIGSISPSAGDGNLGLNVGGAAPSTLLYTSGSTGRPKGVVQLHRNHVRSGRLHAQKHGVGPGDRFLLLSSTAFAASSGVLFPALANGAAIVPFNLGREGFAGLANLLAAGEVTIYQSVPAVFRRLIASIPAGAALRSLRLLRLGGDAVFREDFELYRRSCPDDCLFRVTLSSTEAGSVTMFLAGKDTQFEGPLVPIGSPLPEVEIRIRDEKGTDTPRGEVGEIEVSSPHLSGGYWNDSDLTDRRFRPDPRGGGWRVFSTGDLGRVREDGLLEHRGRLDDRVKIRGYRVEPTAVEAEVRALPEVADAAILAEESAVKGEHRLVAYVVPAAVGAAPARALRTALAAKLPGYMIPEAFIALERLPTTIRGKLDRSALPPASSSGPAPGRPPADEIEAELCRIWERILGLQGLGVDSSFFDLGGQSLSAAQLLGEIERRFDRPLPLPILLEAPTIKALAAVLREPGAQARLSPVVALRTTGSRIPFFCVPGGNGPGFNFRTLARLLGDDQPFYAFHVSTESGEPMPWTIEAWVDRFLPALRQIQPHGPYRLGGHSFGGNVAFEMARRLISGGESVQFIALFDTYGPGFPKKTRGLAFAVDQWNEFLRRPWPLKVKTGKRWVRRFAGRSAIGSAIQRYKHRPIESHVILFRASERIQRRGLSFDDPDNGWRALASDLRTHPVAGSHDTMIEGAGAEEMARWLTRYLSEPTPISRR